MTVASTTAAETGPRLMAERRVPGVKYINMDSADRSNQEPVNKLLKEIIKSK